MFRLDLFLILVVIAIGNRGLAVTWEAVSEASVVYFDDTEDVAPPSGEEPSGRLRVVGLSGQSGSAAAFASVSGTGDDVATERASLALRFVNATNYLRWSITLQWDLVSAYFIGAPDPLPGPGFGYRFGQGGVRTFALFEGPDEFTRTSGVRSTDDSRTFETAFFDNDAVGGTVRLTLEPGQSSGVYRAEAFALTFKGPAPVPLPTSLAALASGLAALAALGAKRRMRSRSFVEAAAA